MNDNNMLRAKEIYFGYCGNSFFMRREGFYDEYKSYNISKEQELVWKEEIVENLYNQLSFEDSYAFHKLAMIAENDNDYSVVEKLITYISNNKTKGDSLIKLIYAEVLLKIPCPKELAKVKFDLVENILQIVLDNPVTVYSSWLKKGFADKLPDEAYIKNRLKKDLNRLVEAKKSIGMPGR